MSDLVREARREAGALRASAFNSTADVIDRLCDALEEAQQLIAAKERAVCECGLFLLSREKDSEHLIREAGRERLP